MAKIGEIYSGSGLKAEDVPDLEDGGLIVTIKGGEVKQYDDGPKIVLSFRETDKVLTVNKTNAEALVKLSGSDDSDDWLGLKIKLYSVDTTYNGKATRGIRVNSRPVKASNAHRQGFDETADDVPPPPRRPSPAESAREAAEQFEV